MTAAVQEYLLSDMLWYEIILQQRK